MVKKASKKQLERRRELAAASHDAEHEALQAYERVEAKYGKDRLQRMATIAMRVGSLLGRPATMQEIVKAWRRAGLGDHTPQEAKSILDNFVPLYRDDEDRVRRAWR